MSIDLTDWHMLGANSIGYGFYIARFEGAQRWVGAAIGELDDGDRMCFFLDTGDDVRMGFEDRSHCILRTYAFVEDPENGYGGFEVESSSRSDLLPEGVRYCGGLVFPPEPEPGWSLGKCCACGQRDANITLSINRLTGRRQVSKSWGCVVCGFSDAAQVHLCQECEEAKEVARFAAIGGEMVPLKLLTQVVEHDMQLHPEVLQAVLCPPEAVHPDEEPDPTAHDPFS